MEENKNVIEESTKMDKEREAAEAEASRVKVLSPGQLVAKRFFRNKLAIVGLVILAVMFIFSFIGAFFSPYRANQVFRTTNEIKKDYATAIINTELRYTLVEGKEMGNLLKAQFTLAKSDRVNVFEYEGVEYAYSTPAPGLYNIGEYKEVATIGGRGGNSISGDISAEVKAAYEEAIAAGVLSFEADGKSYAIKTTGRDKSVGEIEPIAIASAIVLDAVDSHRELANSYDFRYVSGTAIGNGEASFEFDGNTYTLDVTEKEGTTQKEGSILLNGEIVVTVTDVLISPKDSSIVLGADFKANLIAAMNENGGKFEFKALNEKGEETDFFVTTTNGNIYIKRYAKSELLEAWAGPSGKHILGTDKNGMDVMTRLMHGGRVSLIVGFIVILIELVIGIVIGGISGFFGGWVDMALMRFVDLFNSIPYWPMLIIAGSVMDGLRVGAYARLFALMFILGFLGWTGIARIVRGQILTLREQEFMIACEANGIRTSRRIFKHLVPNVMPILIVQATMGLGGVIISEATLSFLGLGAKYPMASWGSIINASTDMYVMTNYWWIWVPAGTCILLTVLGFNFVGDGLRDAFDPKMKR